MWGVSHSLKIKRKKKKTFGWYITYALEQILSTGHIFLRLPICLANLLPQMLALRYSDSSRIRQHPFLTYQLWATPGIFAHVYSLFKQWLIRIYSMQPYGSVGKRIHWTKNLALTQQGQLAFALPWVASEGRVHGWVDWICLELSGSIHTQWPENVAGCQLGLNLGWGWNTYSSWLSRWPGLLQEWWSQGSDIPYLVA